MAQTVIGVGDAKAVKKYSAFLAVDAPKASYFGTRFMGGPESEMPIHVLTDLESDKGEYISYDLSVQLKMQPIEGDDTLENKEERLKFYSDGLYINQMRGGVNSGGRMTRKRTLHDLRKIARKRQSEWWARVFDEMCFMYISGARGVNSNFVFPTTYSSFAGNALSSPDSSHIVFAGGKTKATITTSDKMQLSEIDKCVAYADMMGGGTEEIPAIQPMMIEGEARHVIILSPYQEYDMRTATGEGKWLDLQKALANVVGKASPIFKGGAGMHNGVVIHKHKNVITFSDYGSGVNLPAARALFLGKQALVLAFGSPGNGLRFGWYEGDRDNGNQIIISTDSILGMKKVTFNGLDFGVMAVDTYAIRP